MLHLHRCLKEDGIFMEPFPLVLAAVAAALSLSACATVNAGPSTPGMAERMIVRGSLTYRERIALPPGSVAEVTLQDVSRADAPSTILARQTIPLEGRQVPVPFGLKVDRAQLQHGMRYSFRGRSEEHTSELQSLMRKSY